jgi:hypothetical protein
LALAKIVYGKQCKETIQIQVALAQAYSHMDMAHQASQFSKAAIQACDATMSDIGIGRADDDPLLINVESDDSGDGYSATIRNASRSEKKRKPKTRIDHSRQHQSQRSQMPSGSELRLDQSALLQSFFASLDVNGEGFIKRDKLERVLNKGDGYTSMAHISHPEVVAQFSRFVRSSASKNNNWTEDADEERGRNYGAAEDAGAMTWEEFATLFSAAVKHYRKTDLKRKLEKLRIYASIVQGKCHMQQGGFGDAFAIFEKALTSLEMACDMDEADDRELMNLYRWMAECCMLSHVKDAKQRKREVTEEAKAWLCQDQGSQEVLALTEKYMDDDGSLLKGEAITKARDTLLNHHILAHYSSSSAPASTAAMLEEAHHYLESEMAAKEEYYGVDDPETVRSPNAVLRLLSSVQSPPSRSNCPTLFFWLNTKGTSCPLPCFARITFSVPSLLCCIGGVLYGASGTCCAAASAIGGRGTRSIRGVLRKGAGFVHKQEHGGRGICAHCRIHPNEVGPPVRPKSPTSEPDAEG